MIEQAYQDAIENDQLKRALKDTLEELEDSKDLFWKGVALGSGSALILTIAGILILNRVHSNQ